MVQQDLNIFSSTLHTLIIVITINDENEYEPWDDHLFIFTFNKEFKDFDDYEIESYEINEEDNQISFLCPSFWLDVPREFLISWALDFYDIEAKFVEDMSMCG